MRSEEWYVRHGNDTLGPIRHAELRALARRGVIHAGTAVSVDGAQWTEARHVPEIAFGPPRLPEIPRSESLFRSPKRLAVWIVGTVGVVLLNLCLCSALYFEWLDVTGLNTPEPDPTNSLSQRIVGSTPSSTALDPSTPRVNPALRGAVSLRVADGTDELQGIYRGLSQADQQSIAREIFDRGLDLYAYRIQIRNTGRDAIDIDPRWLKLRSEDTEIPLWDQATIQLLSPSGQPFLQSTQLPPGASVSGLVGFTTQPALVEAIRNGRGALLYNDVTVTVTYE